MPGSVYDERVTLSQMTTNMNAVLWFLPTRYNHTDDALQTQSITKLHTNLTRYNSKTNQLYLTE